jgi:hypothetical protein
MTILQVQYLAVSDLKPNPRNARLHSKKQLHQIAASISEFGFNVPVLIDRDNVIIGGHGRVAAARSLRMETVPVLRIEHLTEAQKRAFALADNKIALNSDWDLEILQLGSTNLRDRAGPNAPDPVQIRTCCWSCYAPVQSLLFFGPSRLLKSTK